MSYHLLNVLLMATTMAMTLSGEWYMLEKDRCKAQVVELNPKSGPATSGYMSTLLNEIKSHILGFVGAYEHVQLSLSCTSFNKLCHPWLQMIKLNGRLSLYITYGLFLESTGYSKMSLKKLLSTHKGIASMKDCLLDGHAFTVKSPFNVFSKMIFIGLELVDPDHPLYLWIITSGRDLTPDLIRIVIEAVNFEEFDYDSLFRIIDRTLLSPAAIKQLTISLNTRYAARHGNLMQSYNSLFHLKQKPSAKTLYALLDALRTFAPVWQGSLSVFLDWIIDCKEEYRDALSIFIDICPKSFALDEIAYRTHYYRSIILHAPQMWCNTEERLDHAMDLLYDPYSISELLLKLRKKIEIVELSDRLSKRLIYWMEEFYPESLFSSFLSKVENFIASRTLCSKILNKHCDPKFKKWNLSLIWTIFKNAEITLVISSDQFAAMSPGADQLFLLCMATFAEKKSPVIRELMLARLPPELVRYFVLKFQNDFLNSYDPYMTMGKKDFESLAQANGYDCGTIEFVIEKMYPKDPVEPHFIPESKTTRDWYEVACANFSIIQAASVIIEEKIFIGLLLYNPARWCDSPEAVHMAISRLDDPEILIHFLDCLPRQQNIVISSETTSLLFRFKEHSKKILLKLLEKFPSSRCCLPIAKDYSCSLLNPDEKIDILHDTCEISEIFSDSQIESLFCMHWDLDASEVLETLIKRKAPALMIKYFCLERSMSVSPEELKRLSKIIEMHPEAANVMECLQLTNIEVN